MTAARIPGRTKGNRGNVRSSQHIKGLLRSVVSNVDLCSEFSPNPSETNFIKESLILEPLSNTSAQHQLFQPLFVAFFRFMQRRLFFYRH
jgi:hypothetical protein